MYANQNELDVELGADLPYWFDKWVLGKRNIEQEFSEKYAEWLAQVKARGNVATRMPSGPSVGQIAERYIDRAGTARYALAPAALRDLEAKLIAQEGGQIRAGQIVQQIEAAGRGVAALPRNVVANVLGIPPWLVTGLVLGGGIILARAILPDVKARVRGK